LGWYGLAGLVVGCGLALAREKLPLGRGPMSRLSAELGSPILGVLPSITGAGTAATRAMQTHLEPTGAIAEASRSISRALAESGLDDGNGRTLLVASMNPAEGRTTLATNLALAMAQSGMKVLLVDANNRSPKLDTIFNLSNPFGLFDVLAGRTDDHPAIHTTNIKNVDVLPCGAVLGNCVELLNNEALVDVLGELSDRYDRVLVDSPPLARGVEARILAANCAAAVLVTAARPSARRQVNQGLRLLRSVGANVLGLVVNEPGAADPLSIAGPSASVKRATVSVRKTKAFRPVLTTGDDE
jgi:capsular exopolysaccharide synthesis family protein